MVSVDSIGWLPSDYDAFLALGHEGAWEPEDLAAVMGAESELKCGARNGGGSGARGLTQFMPDTLEGLDWRPGTPAYDAAKGDFCAAPVAVQLEFVARYFADWRRRFRLPRWEGPTQLFLANFLPAELPHGTEPTYVLAGQGRRPDVYRQNPGLDKNKDGRIEVAEAGAFVEDATRTRARTRYLVALGGIAMARAREPRREAMEPPSFRAPGLHEAADIRGAQVALATLGYAPGPFDGLRGSLTRGAILRFQRDHGLVADGIVGPYTWLALGRAAASREAAA